VTYKIVTPGQEGSPLKTFPNRTAAEEFVAEDGSARIGGVGAFPREPVAALEHYRLVDTTDTTAFSARQYQLSTLRQAQILGLGRQRAGQLFKTTPSWVKTVTGSGADPNETLTASVRLQIPADSGNGTSFVYRQQTTAGPDGEFSFTVPYSTTGYEEFGPEDGYTNVTVRATGPYQISGDVRTNESGYVLRNGATLNVSEADVNGAGDGQVEVTLSESILQAPQPSANETAGNETVGNETAGNETAGNETVGNETAGNETVGNETAGNETAGNESTLREAPFGSGVQTTGGNRQQAAVAARTAAGVES
jgi:dolichyl-diphosphooligosaccharide--protein glycosyltransferase